MGSAYSPEQEMLLKHEDVIQSIISDNLDRQGYCVIAEGSSHILAHLVFEFNKRMGIK